MFSQLPINMRGGLRRLYIAVCVPWVAWFGFQAMRYVDQGYSSSAREHLRTSVFLLLLVPVGAPIARKVAIWIIRGFRMPEKDADSATSNSKARSSIEYDLYRIRTRVAADLSGRPDLVIDSYLRTGVFLGKRFDKWPRLDEAKLSDAQKSKLPLSYYEKGGVDPDQLGRSVGYTSAEAMIDRLVELQEDVRSSGSFENYLDDIVDAAIIKRLKKKPRRSIQS